VAGAVTCASCGATIRADRATCLRCGEPLRSADEVRAEQVARRSGARRIGLTVAAVAACLALGGYAFYSAGNPPAATAAPSPVAASTPAAAPAVQLEAAVRASMARTVRDPAGVAVDARRSGLTAYNQGDMTSALQRFEAAVQANPRDPEALNSFAQVLVRANRAIEAIPYFDRAIELAPAAWAYRFNRAGAYGEMQQWSQAIAGYRDASRLFPRDYATEYNLARALQANGELNAALAGFERAIELAPGQADFHLSYGRALEAAGRKTDAVGAYRAYLELEPAGADAEKVKAYISQLQGVQSPS
jgi:tetratricopeptide (TPR) repeat protein